jgi:EAL domain-containing protein (putative c-di-GMP-specific phosphodiesterase class I)
VELVGGRVVGVEALVRWAHPTRGLLLPEAFLQVADDTGLVLGLGRQVLHAAAHQVAAWRSLPGHEGLGLAVDVSTQELLGTAHLEVLLDVLRDCGLPPGAVTLEVRESVLLESEGPVVEALRQCALAGLCLALDGFGTGSSSLLHLRRVPVSVVKVDRELVAGLGHSRQDEAIVRALLSLSADLGLTCVAEGVEHAEQRDWLVAQGVDLAQGDLLHRPLPVSAVTALLGAADDLREPSRPRPLG